MRISRTSRCSTPRRSRSEERWPRSPSLMRAAVSSIHGRSTPCSIRAIVQHQQRYHQRNAWANLTSTVFTIWANNTGGSDSITFTLVVNEPAPVLSPATQTHTLARTIDSGDILQNLSGIGIVDVWAIHPSLPAGLHFNTGNGTVSGIPTVNLTSTTYTIYANNTGVGDVVDLTSPSRPPPQMGPAGRCGRIVFSCRSTRRDDHGRGSRYPTTTLISASNGTITGTPTTNLTSTVDDGPITQVARTASSYFGDRGWTCQCDEQHHSPCRQPPPSDR